MNFSIMKQVLTSRAGLSVLKVQKNSPTLLFAAGVAGVGATVVTACRSTLKVDEVLTEHRKNMINIDTMGARNLAEYSDRDVAEDKLKVYIQTAVKLTRLYGPSLALGVISIACLTKSHSILSRRNAALTAAYAAVDKAFSEFYQRVESEMGVEKTRDLMYDTHDVEMVEDTDKGPKKVTVKRAGDTNYSPYARLFSSQTTSNWNRQRELNYMFLRIQQREANRLLHSRGYIMLNDVYDLLGLDRTPEGQIVGWCIKAGKDVGDGYVDFGVFSDSAMSQMHDFIVGSEDGLWLDFNVDGNVFKFI